jgi:predicted phage terminase large subunit-like protein
MELSNNELAVAKVMCMTDTLFFTRYFFKDQNNKKFVIGEHHRIISEALDRVFKGECKRLIINIAPRYGKTELAVKKAIAKGLALNPKARFIHLSYSQTLALDNSEAVRDLVKSKAYQQMFPNVKIKPGTDAKEKWYTTEGGGVYATASGGQITGFGAGIVDNEEDNIFDDWLSIIEGFGGAIIIDDPIKPEDAQYDNKRDKINERFDTTIVNRVNSRNTPIIIIMQRVHENDLCGHVIENYKGWEVVSLPVIKKDGSALWPFKHTIEELNDMRKANEFVFDTQMMQDPKPKEGLLFPKDELNYYKPDKLLEEQFESSLGYGDIADTGEDFTSFPFGRNIKDKVYINGWVFDERISEYTIPLVVDESIKQKASYIRVESNSMGAMYGRDLQKAIPNTAILKVHSTTNKHTRILMDAGFIKKNFYFLHPDFQDDQYKSAFKQFTAYRKSDINKKDDAADSISGLALFVRAMLKHYYYD